MKKSLPTGAKLLSLIIYSDATNVNLLGKSQLHLIYLSILKSKDNTEKRSRVFKNAVCETFHRFLELLLDSLLILQNKGIDLILNNKTIWFYPQVSVIIADWPEAAIYCFTYKSSMSNYPYYFCLVTRNNLADLNLQINNMISQIHDNM